MKKAVITVIGQDRIGLMYGVASVLAEHDINILDVNQTIMQEIFTMVMIVDIEKAPLAFEDIQNKLDEKGKEIGVSIRMQHEGIFNAMSEL